MKYIYSQNAAGAVEQLSATIAQLLATDKKVLWLVSGGSGGKVSVDVAKALQDAPLDNLFVTLSDERYGPLGHKDENWQLLLNDGFALPGATLYRPLTGDSREETTRQLTNWLASTLETVDYVIGLFGIGADGHTAGIKPHSAAVTATTLAASYDGDDFERITITPVFIEHINEAVIQAFGEDKSPVIRELLTQDIPVDQQPAQVLKRLPKTTVYSDYKEETA